MDYRMEGHLVLLQPHIITHGTVIYLKLEEVFAHR